MGTLFSFLMNELGLIMPERSMDWYASHQVAMLDVHVMIVLEYLCSLAVVLKWHVLQLDL